MTLMQSKVFLDTSYAIALSVESDSNHKVALQIAASLETGPTSLVMTRAILLEIGSALSRSRYRQAAVKLLTALENDSTVEILGISDDLYVRGFALFKERPDKDWGLIDCISLTVMTDHGISEALTADVHFEQAGFHALLRA